ncbi:glyoxalase-like domain-containing protein [Sarocladium implicatum]|nr:glyoxalase-like domain-containing protein [Sarocladium implicatum]
MSAEDTKSRPILDHLVILVSEKTLKNLPDSSPMHGSYIELIAFYDNLSDDARRAHRWGQAAENTIIDWAFTLQDEASFVHVQKRVKDANGGITYDDPWNMGRKRPDGVDLKWSIGAPRQADGTPPPPGTVPFWCLDQTDRSLRVPYENNPETKHPSRVLGISEVLVTTPEAKHDSLKKVYAGILDGANHERADGSWNASIPTVLPSGEPLVTVKSGSSEVRRDVILSGNVDSPKIIEFLPGLAFTVKH